MLDSEYTLVIDSWEGNPNLDEQILCDSGVYGHFIRLNDINGGHHLDRNFWSQWVQSAPFVRVIYFVYNPWRTGKENFDWLDQNIPKDAKAAMIDIEVKYSEKNPHQYALDVAEFVNLARKKWKLIIYTGAWFYSLVETWPADVDYCLAAYPRILYPDSPIETTWEDVRSRIRTLKWNVVSKGPVLAWQVSGDRLILPGTGRTLIDVIIWKGTPADLRAWAGQNPKPVEPVYKVRVDDGVGIRIRTTPVTDFSDATLENVVAKTWGGRVLEVVGSQKTKDGATWYKVAGWVRDSVVKPV